MERTTCGGRRMKEVTYEDWQKNPTPRMMWVWGSNENAKQKRKVIYFLAPEFRYPVVALTKNETTTGCFKHCAEIEEPKTRRMTNKELSRWLREKPTREYKNTHNFYPIVYGEYTYLESESSDKVDTNILIREDDGEWKEPLVEVEE
jgi:hypothetical protein